MCACEQAVRDMAAALLLGVNWRCLEPLHTGFQVLHVVGQVCWRGCYSRTEEFSR